MLANCGSTRKSSRVQRPYLLLCFLVLGTLVTILGTSVPSALPSCNAQIGTIHHSSGTPRPDRSGETTYEGPCWANALDHWFFLPDLHLESSDLDSLERPIAKQRAGQLLANYFRPPPTL